MFKFPNKSLVGAAGPPNKLLAGVDFGLPKRLLVGSAGLLRFENKLFVDGAVDSTGLLRFENRLFVEGVADFCSPKGFDLEEGSLRLPKRLLVVEG